MSVPFSARAAVAGSDERLDRSAGSPPFIGRDLSRLLAVDAGEVVPGQLGEGRLWSEPSEAAVGSVLIVEMAEPGQGGAPLRGGGREVRRLQARRT
jgi:hypothetical protein